MTALTQVFNFDTLNFSNGYNNIGPSYTQGDFTFLVEGGDLIVFGPAGGSYVGSGAIMPELGTTLSITNNNNELFGISFAELGDVVGGLGASAVEFVGIKPDDTTLSLSLTTDGGTIDSQMLLTPSLDDILFKEVTIAQSIPPWQLDSIGLKTGFNDNSDGGNGGNGGHAVSEPSSAILMVAALAATTVATGVKKMFANKAPKLAI
ncbi:MAG: hypothetical protein H6868_04605 [Rhodospirillales bacterium]|nr:hypothetical protein [Rhodospirillales bacterium]